jgi:hypothetical protein
MDYVGPLDGAEDTRARQAFESWHGRLTAAARRWVVLPCSRCGDRGIPAPSGLCAACDSDASWAAFNRAMCDLLHRGHVTRRRETPRPVGTEPAWAPRGSVSAPAA